jgi:hypothetical protein
MRLPSIFAHVLPAVYAAASGQRIRAYNGFMDRHCFLISRIVLVACAAALAAASLHAAQVAKSLEDIFRIDPDHPAILYSQRPVKDPVALLEAKLESGAVKLDYAPNGWGYLPSLLKELGINVDSQVLVFSKGSIQSDYITPLTPRAIYFNDEVAVGYVQHGQELEITGLDSEQGVSYYTLDAPKSAQPRLTRRMDCLRCHQGPVTLGVPGLLVTSIKPSSEPGQEHGSSYMTDDRVPLSLRWGGWYVSGSTGPQKNYGNNTNLVNPLAPGGDSDGSTLDVTNLGYFFDTSKYLAPTSDVVALMTLEHQNRMINLLTRIGWDTRVALHDDMHDGKLDTAAVDKINEEIEQMLSYMLFVDEAKLTAPITGVSGFAKTFPERGPRDKQGRGLRDFDLKTRMFKYPLSYMIYSDTFDGLPQMARERVYQRLYDILTGKDQSDAYKALSADDRKAILEIVRDTKPNLPPYWSAANTP